MINFADTPSPLVNISTPSHFNNTNNNVFFLDKENFQQQSNTKNPFWAKLIDMRSNIRASNNLLVNRC